MGTDHIQSEVFRGDVHLLHSVVLMGYGHCFLHPLFPRGEDHTYPVVLRVRIIPILWFLEVRIFFILWSLEVRIIPILWSLEVRIIPILWSLEVMIIPILWSLEEGSSSFCGP